MEQELQGNDKTIKEIINPKKKVSKFCECGSRLIKDGSHIVCEKYFEDIKKEVEQLQDIIEELQNDNLGI